MIQIGTCDITDYIQQSGISESTERVYGKDNDAAIKGAHYTYSFQLRIPDDIKDTLTRYIGKDYVSCKVNGNFFYADITAFQTNIAIEYKDIRLWNASITITDLALSEEEDS